MRKNTYCDDVVTSSRCYDILLRPFIVHTRTQTRTQAPCRHARWRLDDDMVGRVKSLPTRSGAVQTHKIRNYRKSRANHLHTHTHIRNHRHRVTAIEIYYKDRTALDNAAQTDNSTFASFYVATTSFGVQRVQFHPKSPHRSSPEFETEAQLFPEQAIDTTSPDMPPLEMQRECSVLMACAHVNRLAFPVALRGTGKRVH